MKYSLGLDMGITSVGWAALDLENKHIEDLGVRLFTGTENPKDGSSLAEPRREARGTRRLLKQKHERIVSVKKLILSETILTDNQMEHLFSGCITSPWKLRSDGLDRCLSPDEWARVLVHIAKYRGFKSNRMPSPEEQSDKASEDGRATAGMKANSILLAEGNNGISYRTVGEMIWKDIKFAAHKHNKDGDYTNTIQRDDLENEVKTLFSYQRKFNNTHASYLIETKYLEIFNRQLPFASGKMIEDKVGFCTLEPSCRRAPKASWTAEKFVFLTKAVNLRAMYNGVKYEISPINIKKIYDLACSNSKVTYKQIKKAIDAPEDFVFENMPSKKTGNPEDAVFIELKAFHAFKKTITKELGCDYWNNIITTSPTLLDTLAFALTYRKTDSEIREYLKEHNVDNNLTEVILPLNFKGNVNLSIEAMTKLIPFMERGFRYDEACKEAGYCHSETILQKDKNLLLPPLSCSEIKNPVVIRAISQARKVINAVIRKYGSPEVINIELARDIAKPKSERKEIQEAQMENKTRREGLREEFTEKFGRKPTGTELERYGLWKEQKGICIYSGKDISESLAFARNNNSYAEVDHILPYSRTFDDSMNNKVLVLCSENRNKGNRTPYEYLGGNDAVWDDFVLRVNCYISNRKKADRLIRKTFSSKDACDMKERSLNDTRYITRFTANWLEQNLKTSGEGNCVHRLNGRATAVLRKQWGVNYLKNRDSDTLHHALDACIIAAATPSMIRKISDFSESKELNLLEEELTENKYAKIPMPWDDFNKEIEARMSDNPVLKIKELGLKNYTDEMLTNVKPIFVSRKPERKATGPAHEETIRSVKYNVLEEGKSIVRTKLTNLNLLKLENMIGKENDVLLYNGLKERLIKFKDNAQKAFSEPFRKPSKNGKEGPIVHAVRIKASRATGVMVRQGIASNGKMVKVEVYKKNGQHFLIPYYVDDIAKKSVKTQAIGSRNKKDNGIIDETYEYLFSLFRNDLIKIIDSKGVERFGYYIGYNISNGAISIMSHDEVKQIQRVGSKTVKSIEKYQADILGEYHGVYERTCA